MLCHQNAINSAYYNRSHQSINYNYISIKGRAANFGGKTGRARIFFGVSFFLHF